MAEQQTYPTSLPKEIIYNPSSEKNNGIEVASTAILAVQSGVAMVHHIEGVETAVRLRPAEDGKAHLTTRIALIALYGMNRFAAQISSRGEPEPYRRRRTELAEAICQKAYGGTSYYPEPSAVQSMLEDERFLREMLREEEGIGRLVMSYVEKYTADHHLEP